MKRIILVFSIMIFCALGRAQDSTIFFNAGYICPDDPWFEIFSDEFEGTDIDHSKWYTYFPYGPNHSDACFFCRTARKDPNENSDSDQVFKDENVLVSGGRLKLISKKETSVWMSSFSAYSSGTIFINENYAYPGYMKWEARMKLPGDPGFWPAFWAFGYTNEFDFFEFWPSDQKLQFQCRQWISFDPDIIKDDKRAYFNRDLSSDFHIYAAEYDPYFVRFYLDGALMHTVARLKSAFTGAGMTNCVLSAGTYIINPAFPHDGQPMSTIIGNGIERSRPPAASSFPDTMEVDYVRIYARGCPWAFGSEGNITQDNTLISPDYPLNYHNIRVADGKTLTIRNTTIRINDYGLITLGRGSRLIIDNSTITSCNPDQKWNGIVGGKNAVIELKNHSVLEKAYKGIMLGGEVMNGANPATITDNPVLIMDSYSKIRDCDIGIHFGAGRTSSTISDNSQFINNKTAILAMSSTGLTIDRTRFFDNGQSIRALDSYLRVRDGSYFNGGTRAVNVSGTYPGAAGIDIGDAGRGLNYFTGQEAYAIDCSGADHPAGANVVNCKFAGVLGSGSATAFYGANQMMFENNTIENSGSGLISSATGGNFNRTQCNIFDNTTGFDVGYAFDNSNSQFLGNQSTGSHTANYKFVGATMPINIGSPDNPAGNCFSGGNPDITTAWNTQSFNYHFYDDGHTTMCEEPITPGNYTKVKSDNPSHQCIQGVGIFGLIDPDGDGVKGFLPSTSSLTAYSGHLTKSAVQDRISQAILAVVSAGGDDPRTLADETVGTKSVTAFEKEEIADQWIRYAVMRGMDEGDYAYAEGVLSPLKQVKWQHHLFGLKLWQAKYTEAEALLATLPARNTDEAYFREVQATNLKRLDGLRNGERFTSQEMSRLETIARSTEPSSAYARSLYYVLTGEIIDYTLPDPGAGPAMAQTGEAKVTGISTGDRVSGLLIYPNPVTDELHVESAAVMSGVEIIDITGRILLSRTPGGNTAVFNTARLARGMYVIRIENSDGNVIFDKMMKL